MERYIGKLLDGRYEILEIIGVGGMAVVYKAIDHRLNRPVAIKILKDDYSQDADFRRRFHGESQAVAMMSHPNIVNVYDVSRGDGMDYIVMELIDGITLKQYMEKKGILSWRETLHFSLQIAKALEHAHSRNIIHRDIKPHNVMILKDGSVKVADFGIARIASAQNTLTKEALGSVHYISPEQARGGRVDNRTDIYSLGVVMYEMLTGRTPYDGETPVSVAIQHINGTPLSPSLLNSTIPIGLEQITMHAMCAAVNIRYASISDMLRDMEEFRKNPAIRFTFLPSGAAEPTPLTQTPRQQPMLQQPEDYDEEEERAERTRRIILIAAIAVVAVVLIVIIVSMLNRSTPAETPPTTAAPVETTLMTAPKLVGQVWDDVPLKDYPDVEFVVNDDSYVYSTEYAEGVVCEQSVEPGTSIRPGTEIYLHISKGEQTDTMPNLVNKSEEYAKAYFKTMDIEITPLTDKEFSDTVAEGCVTRTDPAEGATLKSGQIVTIYISKGPEFRKVKVPAVEGMALTTATAALQGKKLEYTVSEDFSATVAAGYVISQNPPVNTEVEEGSTVALVVSKGKQTVQVISVIGDNVTAAVEKLENLGLKAEVYKEYSATAPEGQIILQNYRSGAEVLPGTTVILTMSLGPEPTEPPSSEPTEPSEEPPPEQPPEGGDQQPPVEP